MSYRSAEKVLPVELVEQIQQYVDGGYLYIPRKQEKRKKWGENTMIRKQLGERNSSIYEDYLQGLSIKELAEKYFLSEKSIQRIICQKRKTA